MAGTRSAHSGWPGYVCAGATTVAYKSRTLLRVAGGSNTEVAEVTLDATASLLNVRLGCCLALAGRERGSAATAGERWQCVPLAAVAIGVWPAVAVSALIFAGDQGFQLGGL